MLHKACVGTKGDWGYVGMGLHTVVDTQGRPSVVLNMLFQNLPDTHHSGLRMCPKSWGADILQMSK